MNPKLGASVSKPNLFQEDFLHLTSRVRDVFPVPERRMSTETREALERDLFDKLGQRGCDREMFLLTINRYLGAFSNQHARVVEDPTPIRFTNLYPFKVHYVSNELFVADVAHGLDSSLIGMRITAIQDRPVAEVEQKLCSLVSAESDWTKRATLVQPPFFYCRPNFYRFLGLLSSHTNSLKLEFATHPPVWVEPRAEAKIRWQRVPVPPNPITVRSSHQYDCQLFPQQNLAYLQFNACFDKTAILEGLHMVRQWMRPLVRAWLKLQFHRDKPSSVLRGIYDPQRPVFTDYLASSIRDIQHSGITNLIIDLRYNAGGEYELIKQLVYHLTRRDDLRDSRGFYYNPEVLAYYDPERSREFQAWYRHKFGKTPPVRELSPSADQERPFFASVTDCKSPFYVNPARPVFTGRIVVLANENTGSAASILAGLIQDNQIAEIVGTTTANNPTGPTGMTPFRLPRSGLMISLPTEYNERACPANGETLSPDYWVENSVADLEAGRDAAFEKGLERMRLKPYTIVPLEASDIQQAFDFLKKLKNSGQLPGWSQDEKGEAHLQTYSFFGPQTVTFTTRKRGESDELHHTLTRVSRSDSWSLTRAWRAHRKGGAVRELEVQ